MNKYFYLLLIVSVFHLPFVSAIQVQNKDRTRSKTISKQYSNETLYEQKCTNLLGLGWLGLSLLSGYCCFKEFQNGSYATNAVLGITTFGSFLNSIDNFTAKARFFHGEGQSYRVVGIFSSRFWNLQEKFPYYQQKKDN